MTPPLTINTIPAEHGADGNYTSRSVSMACQRLEAQGKLSVGRNGRTDGLCVYMLAKEKTDA